MEDGNWFLYAAMIVIAFVSWVFNKIQEATAARQRSKEIREYREEQERDPTFENGEDEELPWEVEEAPRETAVSPIPTSAEDAMRKLMEALGGTEVKAPAPPPPREIETPAPPVSSEPAKPSAPRLSAEERAALDRLKKRSQKPVARRPRVQGTIGGMSFAELVRDPNGIRKAVVLREILDRPRSERPWDY